MRIGIASHIVLDTIKGADNKVAESIGGPPCYCGVTSRRFGFDVSLATRVGKDFPQKYVSLYKRHRIDLEEDSQIAGGELSLFGNALPAVDTNQFDGVGVFDPSDGRVEQI